jgi:hypothetical protein
MLMTASAALLTIDVRPPDFRVVVLLVLAVAERLLFDELPDEDLAFFLDAVVVDAINLSSRI